MKLMGLDFENEIVDLSVGFRLEKWVSLLKTKGYGEDDQMWVLCKIAVGEKSSAPQQVRS